MATTRLPSSVRFEADLHKKITIIAKQNKRSFNGQLEFLAEECVRQYEEENGKIDISTIE